MESCVLGRYARAVRVTVGSTEPRVLLIPCLWLVRSRYLSCKIDSDAVISSLNAIRVILLSFLTKS